MTPRVLVITGPTASGKTALGVALARRLEGEVVSADSMQVYRGMEIGTARPTAEEMGGVPHHMLGVADPFSRYSVAAWCEAAGRAVDDILARGKTPLLVGGTGLYIDSLVLGRDFSGEGADPALRARLEADYDREGGEALLRRLALTDPARAEKLHPHDKKRIVRALEAAGRGQSLTEHDEESRRKPPRYDARVVVTGFRDRALLYERIDRRVDEMLARGLAEEVRGLAAEGLRRGQTAFEAIGYKELAAWMAGEMSYEEAVEAVKRSSRRYAKRQISWCARYGDALRIFWDETPSLEEAVQASTDFFLKAE